MERTNTDAASEETKALSSVSSISGHDRVDPAARIVGRDEVLTKKVEIRFLL